MVPINGNLLTPGIHGFLLKKAKPAEKPAAKKSAAKKTKASKVEE